MDHKHYIGPEWPFGPGSQDRPWPKTPSPRPPVGGWLVPLVYLLPLTTGVGIPVGIAATFIWPEALGYAAGLAMVSVVVSMAAGMVSLVKS
jgi:hypothetical protein